MLINNQSFKQIFYYQLIFQKIKVPSSEQLIKFQLLICNIEVILNL